MLMLRQPFILSLIFLSLPVYIWLQAVGKLTAYQADTLPSGQISYVLSKLFGLLAVVFLWLQICFGLLKKTAAPGHKRISLNLHQMLGILTAATMLAHFLLFFLAVWQRKEAFPVSLLLPQPSDYYHTGLFFGQLAIMLTVLVMIAGRKQTKQFKTTIWWWLHRLSFVIFALVLIHSYMIGSETRGTVMHYVYWLMLVSVLVLLIRRVYVR
jgi:predicted ferric reductase